MYEGGIRTPAIARWPGRIKPGVVSDQVWAFWDVLPTLAELAGQPPPRGPRRRLDPARAARTAGRSSTRRCTGSSTSAGSTRRPGSATGRRSSNGLAGPVELYDLKTDPGETARRGRASTRTWSEVRGLPQDGTGRFRTVAGPRAGRQEEGPAKARGGLMRTGQPAPRPAGTEPSRVAEDGAAAGLCGPAGGRLGRAAARRPAVGGRGLPRTASPGRTAVTPGTTRPDPT